MAPAQEGHGFDEIIASLNKNDQAIAEKLHKEAVLWGYTPKISAGGRGADDWKCEYVKKRKILFALRISGGQWAIRCKPYNLSKYNNILEECNERLIENLIKNTKNCGNHAGGCRGPVAFSIRGKQYSRCRHSFLIENIENEYVEDIKKLLECENSLNV